MLTTLRITESQVLASDQPQTVQALVGARETILTITVIEIEVNPETVLHGQVTEEGGAGWNFLLYLELQVGVVYKGGHNRSDAIRYVQSIKDAAERQFIGAHCL
jgi:hypothetical protein